MTATTPWAQVPDPPSSEVARHALVPLALATAIGLAGPVARTASMELGSARSVLVVGLLATASAHALAPERRGVRLAVVAAAGAVLVPMHGLTIAAWLMAGILLGHWTTRRQPPVPFLPAPGPGAAAPVTALCLVAALSALHPDRTWQPAIPFLAAGAVPVVSRFGHGALDRLGARLGAAVGSLVGSVCFTVLALVTVLVPWCLHRLLRIDPLRTEQGWRGRRRPSPRPASPWSTDPALVARPLARRLKGPALTMVVMVLLVAFTPTGRNLRDRLDGPEETARPFVLTAPPPAPSDEPPALRDPVDPGVEEFEPPVYEIDAAHQEDPWFRDPRYGEGQGFILSEGWRPINPYRLLDTRSKYVNVVGGRRVTWSPPACSCRRLTVWVYGGSTTFGLEQRDDHTISSELARVAAQDGVTLDVHNRGQLGQMHWMESERFAWDLTIEDPPDMVLFYDGVNDSWATNALNDLGTGDINQMFDPTLLDIWRTAGRSAGPVPDPPPGGRLIGRAKGPGLELEALSKTTVERYDRARGLSRATAQLHEIPVRYFWQPNRYTRPLVLAESHPDASQENRNRLSQQVMADHLPSDVFNLTDVLDDVPGPLFTDDVHHNERASATIASAMYKAIRADLKAMSKERSS